MKIRVIFMLLLAGFARLGYAQYSKDSVRTYEHKFPEYNHSIIITESIDSNYHSIIVKNLQSGRLDTIGSSLEGGFMPNQIGAFGFIDSSHFMLITEKFYPPYPAIYVVIEILPQGFKYILSETMIEDYKAPRDIPSGISSQGRYKFKVISPTHIKILDRGKPVALLYFDLEQKKLIRKEIKAIKKGKKIKKQHRIN
ncbi:MAG: hypothetical protein J0L99_09155 [Chitinophagales bacterium]|nr:hypothetical protein [Chitinophagales bacterium]